MDLRIRALERYLKACKLEFARISAVRWRSSVEFAFCGGCSVRDWSVAL
jgi:hypothetical protein